MTPAEMAALAFGGRRERPGNEIWSDAVAPGGYVCAECGMPVESEPCAEHGEPRERDYSDDRRAEREERMT